MLQIKGIESVTRVINKKIATVYPTTMKGLIEAAIIIRRKTEEAAPLTPVDTGNLRASWFTVSVYKTDIAGGFKGEKGAEVQNQTQQAANKAKAKAAGSTNPMVIIGYGANYALYVHERPNQTFQRPGAGAKWFESAIRQTKSEILKTIKANIK